MTKKRQLRTSIEQQQQHQQERSTHIRIKQLRWIKWKRKFCFSIFLAPRTNASICDCYIAIASIDWIMKHSLDLDLASLRTGILYTLHIQYTYYLLCLDAHSANTSHFFFCVSCFFSSRFSLALPHFYIKLYNDNAVSIICRAVCNVIGRAPSRKQKRTATINNHQNTNSWK